jgi:hypothetical protein
MFWLLMVACIAGVHESAPLYEGKGYLKKRKSQRNVESTSSHAAFQSENKLNARFVFHIGIEGTGHHLLSQILPQSPLLKDLPKSVLDALVNLKALMGPSLSKTDCGHDLNSMNNVTKQFDSLVQAFQNAENHLADYLAGEDRLFKPNGRPLSVPLNAFLQQGNQQSYPMSKDPVCRKIHYPDIDMMYAACDAANVMCAHVYLYRDPYQIIQSSTHKRGFNTNILEAAKLYYTMLSVIYAQMAAFDHRTLGCWNVLYTKNSSLTFDREYAGTFDSMRDLYWGPDHHVDFDAALKSTLNPHPPVKDIKAYQDSVVPPDQAIAMASMVRAHNSALALCQRLVEDGSGVEGDT